jgi:peroxiredoxin
MNARLQQLEQKYTALDAQIAESPVKQALSVLHAMVHEVRREAGTSPAGAGRQGLTIRDIAELYRAAPAMEGPAQNAGLPVGTEAPDFALPDAEGKTVRLSDYRGKPVVLVFYPLDWSPGCSQQLDLYQHDLAEFTRRGAVLLGISVDSIYSHGAWAAVRGITFPLLADFHPKGAVAQSYRVYRDKDGFSERALYVVDADGVIRYSHVSPFLNHVPDMRELLSALDRAASPSPAQAAA